MNQTLEGYASGFWKNIFRQKYIDLVQGVQIYLVYRYPATSAKHFSFANKLSPTETRCHVGDRELLAIFQACMKWRSYLHGNRCKVYTDHGPLIYVYTKSHLNAR